MVDEKRVASALVGRRIVAGFVDVALWAIILILAALRFGIHSAGPQGGNISLTGVPFLGYLLAFLAYYVLLEWLWGRTLGKYLVGLRVLGLGEEGRITFVQSLVRNALRCVDGFPYFLPYLAGLVIVLANPDRRRLGDLLARTRVGR